MFSRNCYLKKLAAIIILLIIILGLHGAVGADLASSYHVLKYQYPEFINRMLDGGATEAQIEAFIHALNVEARNRGPLTETNFDSVLFASLESVLTKRPHRSVLIALGSEFSEEIDYTLDNRRLHPDLVPLRRAVWESLFGDGSKTPQEETNAGEKPPGMPAQQTNFVTKAVQQQIDEGREKIRLSVEKGNYLSLKGEDLQAILAAGKDLEIEIGQVRFTLPPDAADVGSGIMLNLSARIVTDAERQKAITSLPPGGMLIGNIFELGVSTEESVFGFAFSKPVKVTFSYAGEVLSGIAEDLLDIYYYDENGQKWIPQKGKLDKDKKTITFTTNSFSKYAIMFVEKTTAKPPESKPGAKETVFKDLDGHWARADVEEMAGLGLVKGVSTTEFAPNRTITRAEFATLLVRAIGLPNLGTSDAVFSDVQVNKWYYESVVLAAKAQLVSGYGERFGPDDPVTREQMAVMITRALSYKQKSIDLAEDEATKILQAFQDRGHISPWASESVARAVKEKIVCGRSTAIFAPRDPATRAEASVMILRMYKKL